MDKYWYHRICDLNSHGLILIQNHYTFKNELIKWKFEWMETWTLKFKTNYPRIFIYLKILVVMSYKLITI
jgi:hypothetical protein